MISVATPRFWKAFEALPKELQEQAKTAYELWREDPYHESLQFKRIHAKRPIYSVRIGLHYRALAVRDGDSVAWFWIGPHADYDKLIAAI